VEDIMPKEIFPSSFACDCGHQSDFSEGTVQAMKRISQKKRVSLGDAAPEEHTIVFYRGKMVEILCPKQPQDRDPKQSDTKSSPAKRSRTKSGIPDDVKTHVEAAVQQFNTTAIRDPHCRYVPRYRGKFLYVDRQDYRGRLQPICRLEYTGNMPEWSFAIYKYSDERYDAEEWFFPGAEHVDGTLEGAMQAGLEAYPS
jgi:hypothetical protein